MQKKLSYKLTVLHFIVCLFLFLPHLNIFAEAYSSSTIGSALTFTPKTTADVNNLNLSAFYAGHFQIGKYFSTAGKISIQTENIIDNGFFTETPTFLTIDELSAAYNLELPNFNGKITGFINSFEAPGTDVFAKKYLGVQNIISPLLYPTNSLQSISIYPINGIGVSLGGKFSFPLAMGYYFYYNTKQEENIDDTVKKDFNFDARLAKVTDNFFIDFCGGTYFPIDTEEIDGELYFITQIKFHAMTTMVIGGNPYTNIFIQGGLSEIETDEISLDDIYLFIEPRFATQKLRFSFSLFCIPEKQTEELESIDHSIGTSVTVSSMPMILFKSQGNYGINICASIPNPAIEPYSLDNLQIQLEPHLKLFIGKSSLTTSLHFYPLNYTDIGSMFVYSLGYKVQL